MAITSSSSIESSDKSRYIEKDTIKDITIKDLEDLKLTVDTDIDQDLKNINEHVERYFDGFLVNDRKNSVTLKVGWTEFTDTVENIIMWGDKAKLDALANYVIDKSKYEAYLTELKNEEIKTALETYSFEITGLRSDIINGTTNSSTNTSIEQGNPWLNDKWESVETQITQEYRESFSETGYIFEESNGDVFDIKNVDVANIYNDRRLNKYMQEMFESEEQKQIRKGTFNINLGTNDGMAGIVRDIRDMASFYMTNKNNDNPRDGNEKYQKIYENLGDLGFALDTDTGAISKADADKSTIKKTLKQLTKEGVLKYTRDWGIDNELGKIAKIFWRTQRTTLDAFTAILESDKGTITRSVKRWHNAETMRKYVKEENVLAFLCDYNSDATISTTYKKKAYKNQNQQGDVGNIFGPQLLFHINQAIAIKNVEAPWTGETTVIFNIMKNIQISDNRNMNSFHPEMKALIEGMMNDEKQCTKANLTKIFTWFIDKENKKVAGEPAFQLFFQDAIQKINGGSNVITPDLNDTLLGKDAEAIVDCMDEEQQLKQKIEYMLTQSQDEGIIKAIEDHGLVYVRETIITQLMTAVDNVEITGAHLPKTQLQSPWISVSERALFKKWILADLVNTLGIHYSVNKGLRITMGKSKSWVLTRKSWQTALWNRSANAWWVFGVVVWENNNIELVANLSGWWAEQYNYKKVINANLQKVKSAQYFGLEWWVMASAWVKKDNFLKSVDAEAFAGINWQQNKEIGLNQIDKQYEMVSDEIFNVPQSQTDNVLKSESTCLEYFTAKIKEQQVNKQFRKFVEHNQAQLTEDAKFIVKYMNLNKLFSDKSILKTKSNNEKNQALNQLLIVLQTGNRNLRREEIISGWHGKLSLTKLSFGVTTNALMLRLKGKNIEMPTATSTSGLTQEQWNLQSWTGSANEIPFDESKFGIYGFYVGVGISTWKNRYVPNAQQHLFTQYEIGQGIGTQNIENPQQDLNTYAKYLKAFFWQEDDRLYFEVKDGKLKIEFRPDNKHPDLSLAELLNLHATNEAEQHFSLKGNTLIIGNVGPIWSYIETNGSGICRTLCLGSEKRDETHRVGVIESGATSVSAIEKKATGNYKERTQARIQSDIITTMTWEWTTWLETVKKETAAFFAIDGTLIKPTWAEWTDKTVVFEWSLENTKLKNGTLTIIKSTDGKTYTVKRSSSPSDKLTITYIDQKEYEESKKTFEKDKKNWETKETIVTDLFEIGEDSELYKAESILTQLQTALQDLEKKRPNDKNYALFLTAASNIIDTNGLIDDTEITKAIEYLQPMLRDNTLVAALNEYLSSSDWQIKSYVVDRLKQIFAKDSYYSGKTISYILSKHNNRQKVTWPSGQNVPTSLLQEMTTSRNERKSNTQSYYQEHAIPNKNIVGYTAFYRNYGNQYGNIKYSMTSLGSTWSQVEPHTISKDNKEYAKDWFLNNLQKNKYEVEKLAMSLEKQFTKQWVSVSLKNSDYTKTRDTLQQLLSWKEIKVASWEKIRIDISYIFYLLGECCNESLGIKINSLTIKKLKDDNTDDNTDNNNNNNNDNNNNNWWENGKIKGKYTGTWLSDQDYTGWVDIHYKSHSVANTVKTEQKKVNFKGHQTRAGVKPTAETSSGNKWWMDQNPSIPDTPSTPTSDEWPN